MQEELGNELQRLFERVRSDPRIVEADRAWAPCSTGGQIQPCSQA